MRKRYSKETKACSVCRAEFDNWISNNRYEVEQEREVRNRFYNYCHSCESTHKKERSR